MPGDATFLQEVFRLSNHFAAETQSRAAKWRFAAMKSALAGVLFLLGAEALIAGIVLAFAQAQSPVPSSARGPLLAALWASSGIGVLLLLVAGGIFRAQSDSVSALPRELHREMGQLEADIRTLRRTTDSFRERHPLQWVVLISGVTYLIAREWSGAHSLVGARPSRREAPSQPPQASPQASPPVESPPQATAA